MQQAGRVNNRFLIVLGLIFICRLRASTVPVALIAGFKKKKRFYKNLISMEWGIKNIF